MILEWSDDARADLLRIHGFLAVHSAIAAARAIDGLLAARIRLIANPRLGSRIDEFDLSEVRRLIIGNYELRYSFDDATILILRIWHTREDR